MNTKRIGFACKWIDTANQIDGISAKDPARLLSTCTTTLTWLNKQSKVAAHNKLSEIIKHNLHSIHRLVDRVSQLPKTLRMVRLSSEVLPMYTEKTWGQFYKQKEVQEYLIDNFAAVGQLARSADVRLSFHPGQFTVLASDRPCVVQASIEEFEYHARMAEMMGYGKTFQDMKINVHISGKLGPDGIRAIYPKLSNAAQNCITIENEEHKHGLRSVLELSDLVPVVLDLHHHWIHDGAYIQPDSVDVCRIIDSWRGVRPVLHYSQSPEVLLSEQSPTIMPDMQVLLNSGYKRAHLRAHSDYYWNSALNQYAIQFLDRFDIMCESKAKNLASFELYKTLRNTESIQDVV